MAFQTIGDLSRGLALRSRNAEIKARLDRLSAELASGRTADPRARVGGDFRPLAAIERSLSLLDSYDLATGEAAFAAETMQTALGALFDSAQTLAPKLMSAGSLGGAQMLDTTGAEARDALGHAVSALNTRAAGRALFAGADTDAAALADADTILAAIGAEVAGLTGAADVMAALDAWFDTPGGGFDSLAYQGADAPPAALRLAEGQSVTLAITAADPPLRATLKGLVAAALLADDTVLGGDVAARGALAESAGETLLGAEGQLTALRGDLGTAQARIEEIGTENAATRAAMELARTDLLAADPYETATGIEAAQTQLETLYAITARLSRLSLADYL